MNDLGDRFKPTGFTRLFRAFGASMKGFTGAYPRRGGVPAGTRPGGGGHSPGPVVRPNGIERVLLIAPMFIVLVVELINSAIEATVDRIGLERHTLSGLAKDIGSAAVFMSLTLLAVVWLLVLWR